MSIRRTHQTVVVAAAVLLSMSATAEAQRTAAPITVTVTPDTARAEAVRKSRALKTDAEQKVLAALKTDARYAPLQKELAEAAKITDEALLRQKLSDIARRAQPLRSDAIRKAEIDIAAVNAQVLAARKPPPPPATPKPFKPPALPGSGSAPAAPPPPVVLTAFTEIDTRKIDCPDAGDTWSFSGNKSHHDVSSGPTDHDCSWIRASKGAFLDVPSGTKHVALTVKLDFELKTIAASIGVWAEAWAEVGVRVENLNGTPIDVIKIGNAPPIPSPISFCWIKPVDSVQGPLDFVPLRDSGDQGLNTTVTCSFDLDPRGGKMMIAPYVGGGVDADLSGYARSIGTVSPRSVEAVFSK